MKLFTLTVEGSSSKLYTQTFDELIEAIKTEVMETIDASVLDDGTTLTISEEEMTAEEFANLEEFEGW